jgi:uncharacterized protein (DUF1330 family)
MAAYVISEVNEVVDVALMEKYRSLAQVAIAQYGGRYLVRVGAFETLEGAWAPKRLIVVEFPSMEQAKKWYHSPEYANALEVSRIALKRRLILVEGTA